MLTQIERHDFVHRNACGQNMSRFHSFWALLLLFTAANHSKQSADDDAGSAACQGKDDRLLTGLQENTFESQVQFLLSDGVDHTYQRNDLPAIFGGEVGARLTSEIPTVNYGGKDYDEIVVGSPVQVAGLCNKIVREAATPVQC